MKKLEDESQKEKDRIAKLNLPLTIPKNNLSVSLSVGIKNFVHRMRKRESYTMDV